MKAVTRFILLKVVLCFAGTIAISQVVPSTSPRWGVHAGGNYNMAGVGYGNWATDPNRNGPQFSELVYNDGQGAGFYGGLILQGSITDALHIGTRISYDNRSLVANDDKSFAKPGTILTAGTGQYFNDEYTFHMDYLTLEPFFKYYVGSKFHITLGVGLGLALNSRFDYAPEAGAKQSDSISHKQTL